MNFNTSDNISKIIDKNFKKEGDENINYIARLIDDLLTYAPWNLTNDYISCSRNKNNMLTLKGIGDPTGGHGGSEFVKIPIKLDKKNMNSGNIIIDKGDDLRKLSNEKLVDSILK